MHKILPKKGGWVFVPRPVGVEIPVHAYTAYYALPTNKLIFKDEESLSTGYRYDFRVYSEHPYTNKGMSELLRLFGNWDMVKMGLINYKRNPHYEYTDDQKEYLDNYPRSLENDFPVEQFVKVTVETGQVVIRPEEYNILSEGGLKEHYRSVGEGQAFIHYLSDKKGISKKVNEQMFYLRSRGIDQATALEWLLGQINSPNAFFIYYHPAVVEYFEREEPFHSYLNKHMKAFQKKKMSARFAEYLTQIREIEGYQDYEPELQTA